MRGLLISSFLVGASLSFGQPGSLDPTFGAGGIVTLAPGAANDRAEAVLSQPDNSVVLGGTTMSGDTMLGFVVRLFANGTVNSSFGEGGWYRFSLGAGSAIHDLAFTADGGILAAGAVQNTAGTSDLLLAKLTSDGQLDAGFGIGGIAQSDVGGGNESAISLEVSVDGTISVVGYATDANNIRNGLVMRFDATGQPDGTFSADGLVVITAFSTVDMLHDLSVLEDGGVLACGYVQVVDDRKTLLVKLGADGVLDVGFGDNGTLLPDIDAEAASEALAVLADGDGYVLAGYVHPLGNSDGYLARLDADGVLDTAFAEMGMLRVDLNARDQFTGLARQANGSWLMCGTSGSFGAGPCDLLLVRATPTGDLDYGFGIGGAVLTTVQSGVAEAHDIITRADDRILVAGFSTGANEDVVSARYLPDACAVFPAVSPGSPIICPNSTSELTTGTFDTYQWYKNGLPIPGAISQTLSVTPVDDAGSWFKVETTIDTCSGMSDSVLVDGYAFLPPVVINAGDAPNLIGDNGEQIYCQGDDPVLVLGAPYDTNVQWSVNGEPIPGANDTLYAVPGSGSYTVEGAPAVCPDFIQNPGVAVVMDFHPYVQPTIYQTGILLCPQPEGLSSQWYYNGQPVAGFEQCVIPIDAGNYTVFVDYGDSCSVLSAPFYLVGLDEYARSDMKASPVPTSDRVIITWTEGGPLQDWRVIDVTGRIVRSGTKATSPLAIDLGALDVGRYRFLSGDGRSLPLAVTH